VLTSLGVHVRILNKISGLREEEEKVDSGVIKDYILSGVEEIFWIFHPSNI
jgi:hypothetical protein